MSTLQSKHINLGHETRGSAPQGGTGRSFSAEDISEAADFLCLPIYMQQEIVSIDQEDDNDAIETFGTSGLLEGWRNKLKGYAASYKSWQKRARSFLQKVLNLKPCLLKEMVKNVQACSQQARQLGAELSLIPCSLRQAEDFQSFLEGFSWVADLIEVPIIGEGYVCDTVEMTVTYICVWRRLRRRREPDGSLLSICLPGWLAGWLSGTPP